MRRAGLFGIVCLFLFPINLQAQYKWFKKLTGDGNVLVMKVCVQPTTGNIIAVGIFENGLNLEGDAISGKGAFILSYDPEGTLVWRQVFFSPFVFEREDTDADGNIYVCAYYSTDAQIGTIHLTGSASSNFLAKFDPTGHVLWATNFSGLQEIIDMDVNNQGNIALTAYEIGTIDFVGTKLQSGTAALLAVFDSDGNLKWTKLFSSSLTAYTSWPVAVAIDNSNNVFGYGKFSGILNVDGHTISGSGNYSLYFAKLGPSGSCLWLTSAYRTVPPEYEPSTPPPNGLTVDRGALAPDQHGGVTIYGEYYNSMEIGNISLPNDVDNPYAANFFLVKLKNDGSTDWATGILTQSGFESAENLVAQDGNYVTSGVDGNQFYFATYNALGQPKNDMVVLPLYADLANGLALDAEDSMYMSGRSVNNWGDPTTFGFVLKYRGKISPIPDVPGKISSPDSICDADKISISTTTVPNADEYQWRIQASNFNQIIVTTVPNIQFIPKELGVNGQFEIAVRAVEAGSTSAYTDPIEVTVVGSPETPILSSDCLSISVANGHSGSWYLNGVKYEDFPAEQAKVYPSIQGTYYFEAKNVCATTRSNSIDFTPFQLNAGMIPNVFTPNDDKVNDFFVLDKKLEGSSLKVFSRDGRPVFTSSNYSNNWNGTGLPTGVYFYLIHTTCQTDPIKGVVSILR